MRTNQKFYKHRNQRGVVILEAAVMLPVFILVAFVLIDIEWMVRDVAAIEYIVTESARCEAIQSSACGNSAASLRAYVVSQATLLRLSTDDNSLKIAAPPCTPDSCSVSVVYTFKPLGAWFPLMTISRTGSAAVPPG